LQVAWRRKTLIFLCTVIVLGLAVAYYIRSVPVYQSSAQVLVVQKRPGAVTGVETRELALEDYVATHQVLIRSPVVIERACKKRDLASLKSLALTGNGEDLSERISKALTVTRGKGPTGAADNVLSLTFRGTDAQECAKVLAAIIESYKDFLNEAYRDLSGRSLKLIAQARDVLEKELADKEAAYARFRQDLPVLLTQDKDGGQLRHERLAAIETRRAAVLLRKAELQSQLATLGGEAREDKPGKQSPFAALFGRSSSLAPRPSNEALLALIASWTGQADGARAGTAVTLQAQLHPLLMEEQKLLETRGPRHPEVQAVRKRIEVTRSLLAGPTAAWRTTPAKGADGQDPVALYRSYCRQELQYCETAEQLLANLAAQEQHAARKQIAATVENETRRADIERRKGLFDAVVRQLQQARFADEFGGCDARVVAPPRPGRKVQPSPLQIFPPALLLGLLLGLSLAYLAEIRDTGFRTAAEVRRTLGLPVIGHIPSFKPARRARLPQKSEAPSLDPMLCAHHRPASGEAEAYRGVRTALFFGVAAAQRKVIQVTSAAAGDGKSLLAANLAVSVAQSGKRVLLIDADLRRPRLHQLFGLREGPGLASVLAGKAEVEQVIRPSGVCGLSLLPCGPRPGNPAELLTSTRLEDLLRDLRDRYDLVLIDTPALLAVTDPRVVLARVDGVLLNVRAGSGRSASERARDLLIDLQASIVGVVVNAMDQHGRGDYELFGGPYSLRDTPSADEVPAARAE
jgi:capsular exopolysaccharide synthesis family protein